MPILQLSRDNHIEPDDEVIVVCEPRPGTSGGWCAAISADPLRPLGMWRRRFLTPSEVTEYDGRVVNVYTDFPPGCFEAHSTLSARKAHTAYFRVAEDGGFEFLGAQGDEDLVVACLNGLSLDELHDARESATEPVGLAPLEGTLKQSAWAARIRLGLIRKAEEVGDLDLAERILGITDATWFIANRDRSLDELARRLPDPAPE